MHTQHAMVIDDDPISRKLIRAMLSQAGWGVFDTSDGEQALAYFQQNPTQLVFLEIGLPGRNGTEICRDIRSHQQHPTRIIAFTHHAQESDKKAFLANGFDDILIKPISHATLNHLLDSLTPATTD
ncbi:DNA-binding response OmpR family regulator [Chitinivorax tropicus]|uniref:DNA-binding response OmpR family regulator n=1 Tax=Chitinivorax tropicus TaxID=714531 RepID=A0A840MPR7_9PROT|nr:response regulator [Chitinivorax tropicus]MBB5020440.1 DNA-binding response OmpR family regulator [Chitinivorax tropicus]